MNLRDLQYKVLKEIGENLVKKAKWFSGVKGDEEDRVLEFMKHRENFSLVSVISDLCDEIQSLKSQLPARQSNVDYLHYKINKIMKELDEKKANLKDSGIVGQDPKNQC